MPQLLYANQYFTTSLNVGGGIDDTQTTGIILSDVTGLVTTKPSKALLGYADPLNTDNCEWVEYTSINGSKELVGVTRGTSGFSAKSFDNGVAIAFPLDEEHINRLADALSIGADPTNGVSGTLDEDDMATNSATKLATQQSIKAYVDNKTAVDGWITAAESWTYASATTITVPTGAAAKYGIGDKIKLTQTTVKYFVVVAVADTLLTVFGGTDYSVANAAITANYYSHTENPVGFPNWFNYTITVTAPGGTAPTFTGTNVCRVAMKGRLVRMTYQLENSSGGTAGSGSFDVICSLPIAATQANNSPMGMSMWYNGAAQAFLLTQIASTTTFKMKKIATTFLQAVDLNNAARFVYGELTYEA